MSFLWMDRESRPLEVPRSRCCNAALADVITRAESAVPGQVRFVCEACGRLEPVQQAPRPHVEGDGIPFFERPVVGEIQRGAVFRTRCAYCHDIFVVHYRRGKFPRYCIGKTCAGQAQRQRRRSATAA